MKKQYFIFFFLCVLGELFSDAQTLKHSLILDHLTPINVTKFFSGIQPVSCIYVINLDKRIDRWRRTRRMFREYTLHPNRVSAINGWQIPEQVQAQLAYPYPCRLRGGVLGCLLSHISVIADANQRHFDCIWVLEDDTEFLEDPHVLSPMLSALAKLDPEWDIFYTDTDSRDSNGGYVRALGSDFRPGEEVESVEYYQERFVLTDDIMRIRSRYGMYSVIISRRGIQKIMDYFSVRPVWTAIDIDIHYIPGIRQYSARRDIVTNIRDVVSDTQKQNP